MEKLMYDKKAFQISGERLSLSLNRVGTGDKPFGKKLFSVLHFYINESMV